MTPAQDQPGPFHHRAYGLTIASTRLVSGLAQMPPDTAPDLVVRWPDEPRAGAVDWFRDWSSDGGAPWLRAGRDDAGRYVLAFRLGLEAVVDTDAMTVDCHLGPDIETATAAVFLCDHVVPLLLAHRGDAVFHGSAVAVGDDALVFLGPSGRGKSTLAAAFGHLGHDILTDDCTVVDDDGTGPPTARPGYPGVRLWEDSLTRFWDGDSAAEPTPLANGKVRFGDSGALPHTNRAVPIRHLYLLTGDRPGELTIDRAAGAGTIGEIVACQFLLDHTDENELRRSFAAAGRLATTVPVSRLGLPADLPGLVDHAAEIVRRSAE